jgi:hypothetical protein
MFFDIRTKKTRVLPNSIAQYHHRKFLESLDLSWVLLPIMFLVGKNQQVQPLND